MESQILVLLNPTDNTYSKIKNSTSFLKKNFRRMNDNDILIFLKYNSSYENILIEAMSQETQKVGKVVQYIYFVDKEEKFGIEQFKNILNILRTKQQEEKFSLLFESLIEEEVEKIKDSIKNEFDFTKWWQMDQLSKISEYLQKDQVIEKLSVMVSQYPVAVLLGPTGQGKTQIFKKFKQSCESDIKTDRFDYVEVSNQFILVDSPPLVWNEAKDREQCHYNFRCFFSRFSKRISNLFLVLKEDREDNIIRLIRQISPLISEIYGKITLVIVNQYSLEPTGIQNFYTKCLKQGFKNCVTISLSWSETEIANQIKKYIFEEQQGISFQGTQFDELNNTELINNLNSLAKSAVQQCQANNLNLNENSGPVQKESDNQDTFSLQEQESGFESQNLKQITLENIFNYFKNAQEQFNIYQKLIEQEKEKQKGSQSEIVKQQILDYCSRPAKDINISRLYQLTGDLHTAQIQESTYNQKKRKL